MSGVIVVSNFSGVRLDHIWPKGESEGGDMLFELDLTENPRKLVVTFQSQGGHVVKHPQLCPLL